MSLERYATVGCLSFKSSHVLLSPLSFLSFLLSLLLSLFYSPFIFSSLLLSPPPPLSSCQDIPEAPERAMTDKINEVRILDSQNSSTSSSPSPSVPHSLTPLPLHPPSPSFSAVFLLRSNHSTWLAVLKTRG